MKKQIIPGLMLLLAITSCKSKEQELRERAAQLEIERLQLEQEMIRNNMSSGQVPIQNGQYLEQPQQVIQ